MFEAYFTDMRKLVKQKLEKKSLFADFPTKMSVNASALHND
ncbi:hypothetical protein JCM19239_1136 [Vibrio variabilis]|uniref:Uncharacterized protein n=1 Tax=Vibrio variabilis TaxID=990271 RepID=A0ABQ0JED0_9VIBR|nr:hypothetical protein JCM19239_1136 [Vibrio variabilis]